MKVNNPDIEAILEAKEKNQLVVFIGAGVSANSGLPSWSELVGKFASKLGINRVLNSEDYLRIPQYFYNERDQLEYNQLIENVFSGQYSPNELHDQILSLNPKHIITTNYDNLIEQSLEKHYLFYNNVFEDKDLPYASNNRLLIKMHGDLLKKNFVLKEDDYLNYSRNFRLIENYIESIFINHTVLFIGYSVQDYDLKLILKRIQSTLGNDYRTAYLINSSSNVDAFEKNYFKKFGINIIDYNCVPEKYIKKTNLESPHGAATFNILNYINEYELDNKDSITYFVKKWSSFKDVNAIRVQELLTKIDLEHIRYEFIFGELVLLITNQQTDNQNFLITFLNEMNVIKQDVIKKLKNNFENHYQYIIEILSKAAIQKITVRKLTTNETVTFEVNLNEEKWKPKVLDYIEMNNYVELDNTITKINSNYPNLNYDENLSLSYAYAHFNKFVSANDQLKHISLRAYKEKKYSMYYLANFNKLVLTRLLKSMGLLLTGNLPEPISEEYIQSLDFDKTKREIDESFNQFISSENSDLKFLKDLLDSKGTISDLRNQSREGLEKVKENAKKTFYPGSFPNDLPKLIASVYDFYRYTSYNLLISNYYSETKEIYTNYFAAICCTYLNIDKNNPGYISPYLLTKKDLIIITNCLTEKEIENILQLYNIEKLYLEKKNTLFPTMLLSNIISSYGSFKGSRNIENKLCSTLRLFNTIEFKVEELEYFIQQFNEIIPKRPLRDTVYISFLNFIRIQPNSLNVAPKLFIEFLQKYIDKLSNTEWNQYRGFEIELLEQTNFNELFFEITSISKANKIALNTESLFKELDFGYLNRLKKEIYLLLLNITPLSEDNFKKLIRKRIKIFLKERFEIDVFLKVVSLNIFVPDKDLINVFKNSIKKTTKNDIISFINHSKNKPQKILNIIKKHGNLYSFLIDPNSYNYKQKNIEIEWIHYLTENKFESLNDLAYKHIKKVIIAKIIESESQNQYLNKIYFKYFID